MKKFIFFIVQKDVYFNETQRPEATAIGLIFLVRNCSRAESSSIGKMIELIGIPQRARDELWRYALGKNTNGETLTDSVRASAVAIISMLAKVSVDNYLESILIYVYFFRIHKITNLTTQIRSYLFK